MADSSFLIALFDADDPRYDEARTRAADPTPILVPPEILSETLGVVQARFGYEDSQTIWEGLGELSHVVYVDSTDVERITHVYGQANGDLSWVDASVLVHCEIEDARPLCFDDAIEKAYQDEGGE